MNDSATNIYQISTTDKTNLINRNPDNSDCYDKYDLKNH
jgi:hypothetical protein